MQTETPERGERGERNERGGAKSGEVCQFFAKSGWCKYGDTCKHEHIAGLSDGPPRDRGSEACKFFAKAGWCQYGDSCRYQHVAGPDTPVHDASGQAQYGQVGYTGPVFPTGKGGSGPEDSTTCQFFAKHGWCKYEGTCRYAHEATSGMAAMPAMGAMPAMPPARPGHIRELTAAESEVAAAALIETPGMARAESVGLQLSDEAVRALLTIPSGHASELLEVVSAKHETLRDPSNYVVSTILKGFVPKGPQY